MTRQRKTKEFNPNAEWRWEGCIEYTDGSFESVWSNPYEGQDDVIFKPATEEEIARHKCTEEVEEQETIEAGVVTERLVFGRMEDW